MMGEKTQIEWTDATWNPIRGCSRVSEGCRNCYAEKIAARFSYKGAPYEGLARIENIQRPDGSTLTTRPRWTGKILFLPDKLSEPFHWKHPRRIFVNSMSDLFHENVQDEWLNKMFSDVMEIATQHTFQILTKRPERMCKYLSWRWGDGRIPMRNIWLGVSVEDQRTAIERIPLLLKTPASIRWVSYEPALLPVDFTDYLPHYPDGRCKHDRLNWIVVGGESGPGARPFHIEFARDVIEQCRKAGTPVFVKQLGAYVVSRNDTGFEGDTPRSWPMDTHTEDDTCEVYQGAPVRVRLKDRKGGDWNEWPEDLRVREYPK